MRSRPRRKADGALTNPARPSRQGEMRETNPAVAVSRRERTWTRRSSNANGANEPGSTEPARRDARNEPSRGSQPARTNPDSTIVKCERRERMSCRMAASHPMKMAGCVHGMPFGDLFSEEPNPGRNGARKGPERTRSSQHPHNPETVMHAMTRRSHPETAEMNSPRRPTQVNGANEPKFRKIGQSIPH